MEQKNRFVSYLTGNVSKAFLLTRILPIIYLIFGITILISDLLFPTAYDWRYMVISDLISMKDNPVGFIYLSIGMTVVGILLIPFPGYIYRRLKVLCRATSLVGTFFFVLGIIGLIIMSLAFDESKFPSRFHENIAAVAFLGFLFAIFFYGFPMMKDQMAKYHGKHQIDKRLFILGASLLWFGFLGTAISAIYVSAVPNDWGWTGLQWITKGAPVLASFALWEWTTFIFILIYFALLIKMIPEQIEPL
jgi:succinate dehydrogenase hydrophobic anchor subunit